MKCNHRPLDAVYFVHECPSCARYVDFYIGTSFSSEHRADAPKGCPVQAGCSPCSEAKRGNPRRTEGQDGPFPVSRSETGNPTREPRAAE